MTILCSLSWYTFVTVSILFQRVPYENVWDFEFQKRIPSRDEENKQQNTFFLGFLQRFQTFIDYYLRSLMNFHDLGVGRVFLVTNYFLLEYIFLIWCVPGMLQLCQGAPNKKWTLSRNDSPKSLTWWADKLSRTQEENWSNLLFIFKRTLAQQQRSRREQTGLIDKI